MCPACGRPLCRECGRPAQKIRTLCDDCAERAWRRNLPDEADLQAAREAIESSPALQEAIRRLDAS